MAARISITLHTVCSYKQQFSLCAPRTTLTNYFLPRHLPPRSAGVRCSSRRPGSGKRAVTSKKINKKKVDPENVGEDIDEDAIEALFRQLEEDLKNDELNGDDDLSEEDLAKLEQELAEALEDDDLFGALGSAAFGDNVNEDEEEDDDGDAAADDEGGSEVDDEDEDEDEDEEEEMPIKLRSWQLRRLGYALKKGRRKTSIKNLAADLCLDRAVVLKLLRDPPPNLVMLSASLPDKPETKILDPEEKQVELVPEETTTDAVKPEVKVKEPIHVMQGNWNAQKRLKKVQVETLEQVYRKSKRPTNAMISSIVHVTNLPRKKVVKWFEDKRAEEGVPENRRPYERSASESESVFTS